MSHYSQNTKNHICRTQLFPPNSHCYIFPISNSTFTSQCPPNTHKPDLPDQVISNQLPLLHICNKHIHIYVSVSHDHTTQICHIELYPPNPHRYIFPIINSTFTSQYSLTTHTTSVKSNYKLPAPTVTYFQLSILHLHLSIPSPYQPHLPYQIITSPPPPLHISN